MIASCQLSASIAFQEGWVRYSGVAHFDHYIWPTWVVILCIILPVLF